MAEDVEELIYVGDTVEILEEFEGRRTITSVDTSTNRLTSVGHNLENGMIVTLSNSGGRLPLPLDETLDYYVVNKTADDFQVSKTLGGAAEDITDVGFGTHYVTGLRDPSTVKLRVRKPDGTVSVYDYPTGAQLLSKLSTGIYYANVTVDQAKTWQVRWESTGNPQKSDQRFFVVEEKNVV